MKSCYCLDTNVFIEAWNKYYSMNLCPDYWDLLDNLAQKEIVFCTEEVKREIEKVDDDLKAWIAARAHFIRELTTDVQLNVRKILKRYPQLIQYKKDRSMADPWVIAHAMAAKAVVVTKELNKTPQSQKVSIPDVCDGFSVPWMNDFDFLKELGVSFSASMVKGKRA